MLLRCLLRTVQRPDTYPKTRQMKQLLCLFFLHSKLQLSIKMYGIKFFATGIKFSIFFLWLVKQYSNRENPMVTLSQRMTHGSVNLVLECGAFWEITVSLSGSTAFIFFVLLPQHRLDSDTSHQSLTIPTSTIEKKSL